MKHLYEARITTPTKKDVPDLDETQVVVEEFGMTAL